VLISLALAEIVLRVAYPQGGSPRIHEYDPQLGHRMRPELDIMQVWNGHDNVTPIRTNRLGLRGPEIESGGDASLTILMLGDSYTFGYGVAGADAFPAVVERRLNQGGERIAVVNAGVSSYGTAQELLQYQGLRESVSADIVVLAIFVGNDVQDNLCLNYVTMSHHSRFPCFRLEQDQPVLASLPAPPAHSKPRGFDPLGWLRNTELFTLASSRGQHFLIERPAIVRMLSGLGIQLRPDYLPHIVNGWYGEHAAEGWALTRALLRRLATEVEGDGSQFAVVAIPSRIQVIPELAEVARTFYAGVPEFEAYLANDRLPQQLLAKFLAEEGIPFLDLLPALERTGAGMGLYYPAVAHWNERGHAVAAEAIAGFLSAQVMPAAERARRQAGSR